MKILIVTGKMREGGAESHVLDLAKNLSRSGHFVCVVSEGGRYADILRKTGVSTVRVPIESKNPLCMANCFLSLCRIVKIGKFDIIHAHTRMAALHCHAVSRRTGVPFVVTVHAKFNMSAPLSCFSRWGQACIAVSEDLKAHLLKYSKNVLSDNIFVIQNGVDTQKFSPDLKAKNGREIVFVSRLDVDCSQAAYMLCDLAPELAREFPNVTITIVGGGSEYAWVRQAARKSNTALGGRVVRAVGGVADTSPYLRRADIFVGVSRAAIEAMACGTRVVLAGNEGFGGVLGEHNIHALALGNLCARECEKLTREGLLCALRELLSESDERRAQRENFLRGYAEKHCSAKQMARQNAAVYENLVKKCAKKRENVLLCGYYGCGNMGDDALLLSSVARAETEFEQLGVCALTKNGAHDRQKFGVRCVCRTSPVAIVRELRHTRVLVLGGGTLLQNSTSCRSLLYYLSLIFLAKASDRRVELWGNGLDRINGEFWQRLAASALSMCDKICVRDRESLCIAKKMCGQKQIFLEEDLASRMPPAAETRIDYILRGIEAEDRKFAVAVFRGGEDARQITLMYRHLRRMSRCGILPVLVVMCKKEDFRLSLAVSKRIGGKILCDLGAADTVGVMSHACAVLGMRYHALVFAKAADTPFFAYGTQPKVVRMGRERIKNKE